jgi:hypothetical protein
MNKNNYNIFLVIIIIIIFLLFVIIYNYKFLNKNECFSSPTGELSQYSKDKILEDCTNNFAKIYNLDPTSCEQKAWVTNPKLLCGICDGSEKNPLYGFQALGDPKNPRLYGCSKNTSNSLDLSWDLDSGVNAQKIPTLLGSKQTCNLNNINITSGMYLYMCCDDYCSIKLNGTQIISQAGWNVLGVYYIKDVKYGDEIVFSGKNVCGPGGMNICYIWNKELYILDNNGFENSANIINYTTNGSVGWTDFWSKGNYVNQLLPWMKNWIQLKWVNCTGEQSDGIITFNVGETKNQGLLNNDLNVFIAVDDVATVLLNNNVVYKTESPWYKLRNFVIPNVNSNDILKIDCDNLGGPSGLAISYLWGGQLYTLPSSLANFNSIVNVLNYTSKNTSGLNFPGINDIQNNLQFLTNGIKGPDSPGKFSLTTIIGQNGYIYPPTKDKWYTPPNNQNIGPWSKLGINSNTSMTISFIINITKTIVNWTNILHVTNTGNNCCSVGDRVPAIWLVPSGTNFHICSSTPVNGNDWFNTTALPLNTPTQVDIQWSDTNLYVYFNGQLVNSKYYSAKPTEANPNAIVYMADPWHSSEKGYQIKDLTFKNS